MTGRRRMTRAERDQAWMALVPPGLSGALVIAVIITVTAAADGAPVWITFVRALCLIIGLWGSLALGYWLGFQQSSLDREKGH